MGLIVASSEWNKIENTGSDIIDIFIEVRDIFLTASRQGLCSSFKIYKMSSIGATVRGNRVSIDTETIDRPEPPKMRQSIAPKEAEEIDDEDDEFMVAPPNENDLAPIRDTALWHCCKELEPIANGETIVSPPMAIERILKYCTVLIKHAVNYQRNRLLVKDSDIRPYVDRSAEEFVTAFICADANRTVNNEYLELRGDAVMNMHVLCYLLSHPNMRGASVSEFSNTKQYYVSKLVLASIAKHMHMISLIMTEGKKRSVDSAEDATEALVGALTAFGEKAFTRIMSVIALNHVPFVHRPDGTVDIPAGTQGITPLDVALLEGNLAQRFVRMIYDGIGIDRTKGESPHKTFLSQLVRSYTPGLKFKSDDPKRVSETGIYTLDVSVPREAITKIAAAYGIQEEPLRKILVATYKARSDKDGVDVPPRTFAHMVEKLKELGITPYAQSMKLLKKVLKSEKNYGTLVTLLDRRKDINMHVKQIDGDEYEATFNIIYKNITGTKAYIVNAAIAALSAA